MRRPNQLISWGERIRSSCVRRAHQIARVLQQGDDAHGIVNCQDAEEQHAGDEHPAMNRAGEVVRFQLFQAIHLPFQQIGSMFDDDQPIGVQEVEQFLRQLHLDRLRGIVLDLDQALLNPLLFYRVQVVIDRFGEFGQRVIQLAARIDAPLAADLKVQQHGKQEEAVNDGRCRRIKIVVGGRDELADLVDEQADADAAQDGR